ncbi:unnamed protein product [Candidula unifasciata]|uniref:Major facilitator superfamily (MFS) profile domain-containing protein n=1 Tax=Candidula unifasciata TaxID=100452 RepID=A0A8S3YXW9_9EUPU|nr:unnamed protein product [Candidula unifasciata]
MHDCRNMYYLDLFGVSMIMPLILPHAQDIGASPTLAGLIGSVYGGIQLFSSPLVGRWSDRVGRQFSLFLCLLLSGCGYSILGLYSSLVVLFVGRFVLGCFKHSQTISKAFLADIGADHERSALLGNFNSFSNIGFVVGPIIGGHLAEISFSLAAFAAGIVFIGNAVLIWFTAGYDISLEAEVYHPEIALKKDDNIIQKKPVHDDVSFSFSHLVPLFRDFDWAELWDLFLVKFFAGFSVIIFRGNFTMVLKEKFEAGPKAIGYITSYSGAVATLSGFLVGKVTERYNSTAQLLLHVTILQVVSLLCLTLSTSIYLIFVFLTPLSIVTSVSRVAGATLTISRSGDANIGSIMGLSQSVMAVARMSAPFFAGIAQEYSIDGAAFISVISAAISVIIMLVRPQDPKVRHKLLADFQGVLHQQ